MIWIAPQVLTPSPLANSHHCLNTREGSSEALQGQGFGLEAFGVLGSVGSMCPFKRPQELPSCAKPPVQNLQKKLTKEHPPGWRPPQTERC